MYLMKRTDLLLLLGLIAVLITGFLFIIYYFSYLSNECLRSPLVYGAKDLETRYDREVHGVIYILPSTAELVPRIEFNSTNIEIKK